MVAPGGGVRGFSGGKGHAWLLWGGGCSGRGAWLL